MQAGDSCILENTFDLMIDYGISSFRSHLPHGPDINTTITIFACGTHDIHPASLLYASCIQTQQTHHDTSTPYPSASHSIPLPIQSLPLPRILLFPALPSPSRTRPTPALTTSPYTASPAKSTNHPARRDARCANLLDQHYSSGTRAARQVHAQYNARLGRA